MTDGHKTMKFKGTKNRLNLKVHQHNLSCVNTLLNCCILSLLFSHVATNVIRSDSTNVNLQLRFYDDQSYTNRITNLPTLDTSKSIYVEVAADDVISSQVKLVVEEYWASVSSSSNELTKLILISNGCSSDFLIPATIYTNGRLSKVRFSHRIFLFRGYSYITLHAKLKLCSGNCEPICSSRRRRDADANLTDDEQTIFKTAKIKLLK